MIVSILTASQMEEARGWFVFPHLGLPLHRPLHPLIVRERCTIVRADLALPPVVSTRRPSANLVLSVSLQPDVATPSRLSSKGYMVPTGCKKGLLKNSRSFLFFFSLTSALLVNL